MGPSRIGARSGICRCRSLEAISASNQDSTGAGMMGKNYRWGIAAAGFLLQMALGAVYAWSVFRTPLVKQFHWTISQVTLTFTICIFVMGFAAFAGGLWLNKKGPRPVALTGGFL